MTIDTITAVRQSGIAPLNVGDFVPAAGLDPAHNRGVWARSALIKPPNGQSATQYLRESLGSDLKASGKLDEASSIVISGELTENKLNTWSTSSAVATLSARFRVQRNGNTVYDKVLITEDTWPSAFLADIAVLNAVSQYAEEFSRLLAKLYADEDFKRACAPSQS